MTRPLDSRFLVSLSSDDHAALFELAKADNRSAAEWVRHQIRTAHAKLVRAREAEPKAKRTASKR